MLASATRLCDAKFGILYLSEDDGFRAVAMHNVPSALAEARRNKLIRFPADAAVARAATTRQPCHQMDARTERSYIEGDPQFIASVNLGGMRTVVSVPLLKDDHLVGVISIYRQEVRTFTDKQIGLVANFAHQAVIAIENARLLKELRQRTDDLSEALEQQTATAEVLQVISTSTGELEPVFQAMLENATRICGAHFGSLWRFEDGAARLVSNFNHPAAFAKFLQQGPHRPGPHNPITRVIKTSQVLHIVDYRTDQAYLGHDTLAVAGVEIGGIRTLLVVPMIRDDELLGAIGIFHQEVRPFTEKQIALVASFASQAVIAIENTRLLNELRKSLEQQTATSEVLRVISSTPGELEPVFQAMLENAVRICEAKFGTLFRYDGNNFHRAAWVGTPAALVEFQKQRGAFRPDSAGVLARVLRTKQIAHSADSAAEPNPGVATTLGGARSIVGVPMLKDDELVGAIVIYRQEVRPFTDKQIELVRNFAAQAVIAIENTRLLNELRQSLEQQTATADVLRVINASPGALEPVFQAMLENAARLCEAKFGNLFLREGDGFRSVAMHSMPSAYAESYQHDPIIALKDLHPHAPLPQLVETQKIVHIPDLTLGRAYMERDSRIVALVEGAGARTDLIVPMLRENELVGAFAIYRQEVRPFTDKQIELVQNLAAQAVIAIENTRLLNELRESLQQQTATAEVLKTISRTAFDLQRVLQTLLENAAHICGAKHGIIFRYDGESCRAAAAYNAPPGTLELWQRHPLRAGRSTTVGRALLERRPVQIPDVQADPEYDFPEAQKLSGFRTVMVVPLLRDGLPLGAIGLWKTEVAPFTDKQIELLTTFADQAVIAIENVRLFDEIQDKSRQLAEASQHKSQFLANMSHELRTPLNAILGYTELILDSIYGEMPEKARAVLDRVQRNGRHLLGLINEVLDLSKIEAGQFVLVLADYSLKAVVETVYTAVEQLAKEKKLAFSVDVAPDLPAGHGDERRLTQVLLNLVGNAIKFTDRGEVAIKASAANGSFEVAVRDTGPGISEADQAKLFQEFQQADNSITRKKGGTGLGLAISKRIIEMHGGRIWVESVVGHGSTFSFMLPVMVEQQAKPA